MSLELAVLCLHVGDLKNGDPESCQRTMFAGARDVCFQHRSITPGKAFTALQYALLSAVRPFA